MCCFDGRDLLGAELVAPPAIDAATKEPLGPRMRSSEAALGLGLLQVVEARPLHGLLQLVRGALQSDALEDGKQRGDGIGGEVLVAHEVDRERDVGREP